jgi:hypothetical protein
MAESADVRVECYSGHTYAQEPRAVVWQGRRMLVSRIERRWRRPQGPAFVVNTEPGIRFELSYGELEDIWSLRLLPESEAELPQPAEWDEDSLDQQEHN